MSQTVNEGTKGMLELGVQLNFDWLTDLSVVREIVQGLDEAGFAYVTMGGHILTAPGGSRPDRPAYSYSMTYRDPFVLFANLAAVTRNIRFQTGVLLLPLFSTVHVAKQAADLSLLSDGRFELGVGIGSEPTEYRSMGREMAGRGQRFEEQIEVLRLLWTEPFVTFEGQFHTLADEGLGQRPDRPVPIWFGCTADARLLQRVARLGEGWMPMSSPTPETVSELQGYAQEAGRSEPIGVAGRLILTGDDPDKWAKFGQRLRQAGATAISITTLESSPEAVVASLEAARAALQTEA